MPRIFMQTHSINWSSKQKNRNRVSCRLILLMNAKQEWDRCRERRKQGVRGGARPAEEGGNKLRQHPEACSPTVHSQPVRSWEKFHTRTKLLVMRLVVPAHQTPDLTRPSLKPCFLPVAFISGNFVQK